MDDSNCSFKVPEQFLKRSQQRLEKIGNPDEKSGNLKTVLCKIDPSKEVLQVEKLKKRREERRRLRLASEQSFLTAIEKRAIFNTREIEKFRSRFKIERNLSKDRDVDSLSDHPSGLTFEKDLPPPNGLTFEKDLPPPKIQVCVRKRPMLSKESNDKGCFDVVTCKTDQFPNARLHVHEPKVTLNLSNDINTHSFSYDHVFDEFATNSDIYTKLMEPLINVFLSGGTSSMFAFGQTASGKTHTIFGDKTTKGLLFLLLDRIFETKSVAKDYHLTSTFVEIYKDEVLDLYAGQMPVKMFEDFDGNIQLQGQKEIKVTQKQDLLSAISLSLIHRSTGQTEANNDSSRSHAVFTLALWDESRKPYGKFTLVDLAGAERGYERGNQDKRSRLEGAGINKSLLALKECIRLLHLKNTRKNLHIPFRDSKLTQILREILIGKNSHTAMMCCISPSSLSVEPSLNTLRYANRFKELRIDESKTVSDKIVLPHIDPEITPISELSIERIEKSFEELNEKLEDIMKEHLMCLNESSNISKEERLIIALSSPKNCKKEYLSQALKLIETKIIKLTHLQAKMKALNNIS